ncbi:uncharacterized protein LOC129587275 [Paramacrobiotus metropolitanus]|uniref:uncharacterized protein LOC129587275 n=1 Tax=Paramacrobiotus metropolitanus TaxID=2943436 RepID=UPI0024461475|nr:uncharacterized protein LOC129587275 [Paramacrobiotus metropolitanus]
MSHQQQNGETSDSVQMSRSPLSRPAERQSSADSQSRLTATATALAGISMIPAGEGPLSLVDRALHSLATASGAQQITAGGATGWLSGYLFNKFGRPVIYNMGSSLIVVLFAEHLGYLTVDWSKFRRDYHGAPAAVWRSWTRSRRRAAAAGPGWRR